MARLTVKVAHLQAEGLNNLSIRLEPLGNQLLPEFSAGAHIDVFLPGGLVRQYSIASAPLDKDHYELCIKKEPESRGGSRFLHEALTLGDILEISAPRNLFALQAAQHHVLVAAGIGITPLLSMATQILADGHSFALHYYTKNLEQSAYAQRLRIHFAGQAIHLHHSDDGASPRHHLPSDFTHPQAATCIYLCGPTAFMKHMTEQALALGWAQRQLFQEAFSAAPPTGDLSVDGGFEVELRVCGRSVWVEPKQSIAHTLIEMGIDVPLSCEQGFCGACITKVLAGVPCHRDSVLSDEQKALNDQMTLCCSRSQTSRLVLDL